MKHILIIFFLLLIIVDISSGQPKRREKVKRKYRVVEQVERNLPDVIFRGRVRDIHRNPLSGVSVEVEGFKIRVHTNADGEFFLSNLPTGRLRIKYSYLGYRTKTIDYVLQEGYNDHYVALDQNRAHLEPLTVSSQKREQQIPDIPAGISAFSGVFAEKLNITGIKELTGFVPNFHFEKLNGNNSGFSIQGSTGGGGFLGYSPSVAVIYDNVPVEQQGGLRDIFFDIDRIELIKGPQNTLFGRDAFRGAIHIVSKEPEKKFGGYVIGGVGNFGKKEIQGAINVPVVDEILYFRAAGIYHYRDGYVSNTAGGNLNGDNLIGGRISVRFFPAFNHRIDLVLNYRNNDEQGIAFMNSWYPNEEGETGLFNYNASLNRGEELGSGRELREATLTYKFSRDEHNYWTAISSYRKSTCSSRLDADGTALAALDIDEETNSEFFFQEIRYNFSRRSRNNGSAGFNYIYKKGDLLQVFSSNDQLLFELLNSSGNFVLPADSRFPVKPQPLHPAPLADVFLTGLHGEEIFNKNSWQSAQGYVHFTYQFMRRLFVTIGARAFYNRYRLTHQSIFTSGYASSLGQFTGSQPNLIFLPSETQTLSKNSLAITGIAGITYRRNENFNIFVNVIRGRRPPVLQFTWDSKPHVLDAEKVISIETGWKAEIKHRIFWDAIGFYRNHKNVQTLQWKGGQQNSLFNSHGKAISYGVETGLRGALIEGVNLFGNYSWMQSAFDSTDVNGMKFIYAGNNFAHSPEHSFTLGARVQANMLPTVRFFLIPYYTWKSHFWFTESNTRGLEQPSYGLLNIITGFELPQPNIIFSIYGTNLLEENYITSAGHWGGLFGLPTFIPGQPGMLSVRLSWKF